MDTPGGKIREELLWSPQRGDSGGCVSDTRPWSPLHCLSDQTRTSESGVCLSVCAHESPQGCSITSKYSASSILYMNSFYCILSTTRVTTNVFVRGNFCTVSPLTRKMEHSDSESQTGFL